MTENDRVFLHALQSISDTHRNLRQEQEQEQKGCKYV